MIRSLRRKIIFGFLAVGLFVVTLSMVTVVELFRLERGLSIEESLSDLVDAVMEARRFEKNYILYQEPKDLSQSVSFVRDAEEMLDRHADLLVVIGDPGMQPRLQTAFTTYRAKLNDYVSSPSPESENELRAAGKTMIDGVHQLAAWRRGELHRGMRTHRYVLIGVVSGGLALILIVGALVSLWVTRPLRGMQARMEEIASGGRLGRIDLPSEDAEIRSLVEAFNLVLGELDLRSQQILVSEKLASLGVMLSGVAHELNNPLSNISTSCQILQEEGAKADPEFLMEHLAQMDEQTERAKRIVASLLDFSRNQKFLQEPLPLLPLVQETLSFVRGQMPPSAVVEIDVPDDLALSADRQRLQQVLINLIKNAAEAGGDQNHVRLTARKEGGMAVISVADKGCGISKEDIPHIFDPFFTTKEVGKGSGLGLFIVHDIVKKHGGTIEVASTPGAGTEFLIRLPLGVNTTGQG